MREGALVADDRPRDLLERTGAPDVVVTAHVGLGEIQIGKE